MQSQVDFANIPNNRIALQHVGYKQGCNLWRNRVMLLSFSEQLIQPYLEGMRRTGTGLLEVRDFLRVKLDLWLPVQKSSTSVRQRSGHCWHPARAATDCEQNGGNLNQLRHKLQPWLQVRTKYLVFADWEDALLNPAGKNSSGCYTNMELDGFSQHNG